MKKHKSVMVSSLIIVLLTIGNFNLNAQNSSTRGPKAGCQSPDKMRCEHFIPDLTEDQTAKIKDLRTKMAKSALPLRNEIRELEAKLNTLESKEKTDMKEINSVIDQISQKRAELRKLYANHKQEVRKLLTEEQRLAFDMHQSRRGQRMGYGHGHRGGHGMQRGPGNCNMR